MNARLREASAIYVLDLTEVGTKELFDETDAIAPLHELDDDRSRFDNCSAPDSSVRACIASQL